ncbi:ABC transporter [Actinoplanes sp. SE50]|nr:ABC transporter related protein [Actinoplanes sp. SE50/110]ATO83817.1 ABC transporter [Actinoplanes sp. SE50]SLM01225.1 hypothetical protein ACSP50_4461 [Actinoplanes sp. SE50/110]
MIRFGLTGPAAALLGDVLRGSGRPLRRIAVLSVAEAAPALASGWVTAAALDRGFLQHRLSVGLAWLAVLAGLHLLRAAAERALFDPLAAVVEPMRDRLTRRVVHHTLLEATSLAAPPDTAGVSRLTSQVDAVRDLTSALLRTARPLAITLLAAGAGLTALDPVLSGPVLAALTVALVAFAWSIRRVGALRRVAVLAAEDVAARVGEVLTAARDITALGAEEEAAALVEADSQRALRAMLSAGRAAASRVPVVLVGGHLPLVGLLLAAPHLIGTRAITAGTLIGAATYLAGSIVPALRMLTSAVGGYWNTLALLLHRLAEVAPDPVADPVPPAPVSPAVRHDTTADLTVAGLTFAYAADAEPVLRDLTLTVPYGDHLAITGASGIGKSTLALLLAGIRQPSAGQVRIGGRPAAGLPEEQRHRLVALVPQEAYVFPGSVRDNLRYLAPSADDDEVVRAVAAVGMTTLLGRLGGLDAELNDPAATLSDGERQLIALARTYLSPAPVVILDEATAHLDPAAETVAEAAFRDRPGTLIVIAHRTGSAARARRVLHLDGDDHTVTEHLGAHT